VKTRSYAGKDVSVIGAGQSALEAAALRHERGARVRLVVFQVDRLVRFTRSYLARSERRSSAIEWKAGSRW
jgi:cation diffusion facilitator CzcD-associated flavoprotein CzcO